MSRMGLPPVMIGNEFMIAPPRLQVEETSVPTVPVVAAPPAEFLPVVVAGLPDRPSPARRVFELVHRRSLIVLTLLFLLVGSAGIRVGGSYWSAHIINSKAATTVRPAAHTIAGLNLTVPSSQLGAKLQSITAQPASLTVGGQTVAISADTIRSWLQITANRNKSQDYISIKPDIMTSSLTNLADQFVKAPVNQVTVTHADGSSAIILAGRNGTKLTNPDSLKQQVAAVAKTVMNGRGLQFNAPLETQAFAIVTPAAFPKLIEVNVTTKQMYLYDNGQLTRSYPITAGTVADPTPLGEFHIWDKLLSQTMIGPGYVQPNVQWINYFDHAGDAVHGNYWRPLSYFGSVNSSHGCVSLPNAQAEWVYDWAPLGTTVITHA